MLTKDQKLARTYGAGSIALTCKKSSIFIGGCFALRQDFRKYEQIAGGIGLQCGDLLAALLCAGCVPFELVATSRDVGKG